MCRRRRRLDPAQVEQAQGPGRVNACSEVIDLQRRRGVKGAECKRRETRLAHVQRCFHSHRLAHVAHGQGSEVDLGLAKMSQTGPGRQVRLQSASGNEMPHGLVMPVASPLGGRQHPLPRSRLNDLKGLPDSQQVLRQCCVSSALPHHALDQIRQAGG